MADWVSPHPGILLYTRIKKSPYYYAARRHGVQLYSVYNHHYHPRLYRDPIEEYWQLIEGVTVWDVGGAERQVEISGPDAFRFTNMLTPRNLERCAVGQCKYAFVTDERGGIINDPVLLRLGENHFWLSLADSDVLLWAKGVAYHAGMQVTITEPDVAPLQIQGPKSKEVMTGLFGADILALPYYHMVERELEGMRMVISRTGYSGELGYELYLRDASRDGVKLWDAVIQAGEPYGLAPIGPSHIRRIEGGILAHGCDMTIEENPYEVGYGYKWMVELEQEQDFIGREALRDIAQQGVSRKLVGVELGGSRLGAYSDGSMPDFFPVMKDGALIGKVTSACFSPRLEKNIGYAMVPVEHSELGTQVIAERPDETVNAVVADRVFFRPEHAEEELAAGAGSPGVTSREHSPSSTGSARDETAAPTRSEVCTLATIQPGMSGPAHGIVISLTGALPRVGTAPAQPPPAARGPGNKAEDRCDARNDRTEVPIRARRRVLPGERISRADRPVASRRTTALRGRLLADGCAAG